jgi:catenin beta 1
MFPETLTDPDGVPFVQISPERPAAIQFLAEPSQQLKDAVVDIINYQIDVDFAAKFVPEITKLLADKDRDVVRNAAELSHDLSKSEAACFVMTQSPQLVTALIKALASAKEGKEEKKMKEAATGTLFNLGRDSPMFKNYS